MKVLTSAAGFLSALLILGAWGTARAANPDVVVRPHNGRPTVFILSLIHI